MSKNIELFRLRQILMRSHNGLSVRQISQDLAVSRKTISKYVNLARGHEDVLPDLMALDDTALADKLGLTHYTSRRLSAGERRALLLEQVDYYRTELKRPGVTLQLLWEEYMSGANPQQRYSYPSFCRLLRLAVKDKETSFHKSYKPGEVLMIDFAGDPLSYVDKSTGEVISCPVYVGVLGYSNYAYVEVLPNARLPYLLTALTHNLDYIQGVPLFVLSDNMAQLVTRADRYEPTFTTAATQWANHNGTMLETARPSRPCDKSLAEGLVRIAYQRIYAPLRDRTFYSLGELNEAVGELLGELNGKKFQNRSYSRYDQFVLEELPQLHSLPKEPFKMQKYAEATVQKNYHVHLGEDKHFYSVPYQLVGKKLQVSYTTETVEIYHEMVRVAIHARETRANGYTTTPDHMPVEHQEYAQARGYRKEDFLEMAGRIGSNTRQYIERMLEGRRHQEHAYNGCLGVLRLGQQRHYGPERLEKACGIGVQLMKYSYKTIETILETGADRRDDKPEESATDSHENLRGPDAF